MAARIYEYQEGCFLKGHHIWNFEMEKRIPLHCNKYGCPLHGWKKKLKLSSAIADYLKSFKRIRFWTFTLSSKGFSCPSAHHKVLALAFRYFTIYMRRHKKLTCVEQDFQYVKCVDLHKSGFLHFHGFFDRYISIVKVIPLWRKAVRMANGGNSLGCSVHAKGLFSPKKAARYIAKYVVKAAQDINFRLCYYSKSSKVSLFKKRVKNKDWIHTYPGYGIEIACRRLNPLLVPKIELVTNSEGLRAEQGVFWGKYSDLIW